LEGGRGARPRERRPGRADRLLSRVPPRAPLLPAAPGGDVVRGLRRVRPRGRGGGGAREGAPPERRLAAAPARRGDERARPRRQPGVGGSVARHLSRPPRDARRGRTVHALPGAPEDLGEEATRRALRASPPRRRRPRPAPRPPPPRGGGARDAPPLPRS